MKLFGREPALYLAVLGSVLTMLAALNLDFLNAGQAAAITVLVTAVVTAVTTSPKAPALFTGVVAAGVALLAEYGLHLSDALVGGLGATVLSVFALMVRSQVSPVETPVTNN